MSTKDPPSQRFHGAVPILRVTDLERSLEHYQRVLGFRLDWHSPGVLASVTRDGASIMLCQGDQGRGAAWVWIGVADAAALHAEYAASGAVIRLPPTNYPWADELHVEDPDGNVLRLGSAPERDRPLVEWVRWYGVPVAGPLIPIVRYDDARAAIAWLCAAFGFRERFSVPPSGAYVRHAQLSLGSSTLMLGSTRGDDLVSPNALGVATQALYAPVPDPDAHCARARAAGAEITSPPQDTDFGAREYHARDLEGHPWTFGTYRPAD